MSDLGQFTHQVNSWRKLMASCSKVEDLVNTFHDAVEQVASFIPRGLNRGDATEALMDMASSNGLFGNLGEDEPRVEALIREQFEKVKDYNGHGPQPGPQQKPKTKPGPQPAAPPSFEPHLYVFPNAAEIPMRAWLYGYHYMRGTVVATVAPGGFGKTTLALYEALEMARDGKRVWYISGEDDLNELHRRIAAHCKKNNIPPSDFGDRLFVDDKMSYPFKIAKSSKNGPHFDLAKLKAFEDGIESKRLDVVIIDPLVSFHLLPENDTAAMDSLVKCLGEICTRRKCCIELAHHVRKPGSGQFEITVYDARGAAAIVNAVRSCRVLNQMSIIEARQMQKDLTERLSYIRIDSGKANMRPPEKAKWLHLVSEEIDNGDKVQVIEPFEFKPQETTVEDEDWVRLILGDPNKQYRADSRSDEWFGHEVGRHFGRDTEADKDDIVWVQKQIKKWLNARGKFQSYPARGPLIRKVERLDESRQKRKFFELVEEKANANSASMGQNE